MQYRTGEVSWLRHGFDATTGVRQPRIQSSSRTPDVVVACLVADGPLTQARVSDGEPAVLFPGGWRRFSVVRNAKRGPNQLAVKQSPGALSSVEYLVFNLPRRYRPLVDADER